MSILADTLQAFMDEHGAFHCRCCDRVVDVADVDPLEPDYCIKCNWEAAQWDQDKRGLEQEMH